MKAEIESRGQNPEVLSEAVVRLLRTYRVVNSLFTVDDKFIEIATHDVEVAINPGGALKVIHAGGANGDSQEREMKPPKRRGSLMMAASASTRWTSAKTTESQAL